MQVQVCISIVWAIKLYQLYFVQNASFWQQTFYFVYIFYKNKTKNLSWHTLPPSILKASNLFFIEYKYNTCTFCEIKLCMKKIT